MTDQGIKLSQELYAFLCEKTPSRWQATKQDKHDAIYALLTVVGSVLQTFRNEDEFANELWSAQEQLTKQALIARSCRPSERAR